jgi:putative hydrolase of the HAD superfamily
MGKPSLIIDLDGTQVRCGEYYVQATERGAEYLSQVTGFSVSQCRETIERLDLVAVSLPDGFMSDRYPQSFGAAALALCHLAALRDRAVIPYGTHMLTAEAIGRSVFDAPYTPYDGVLETLEVLKADYQLILYTKGDPDVQRRKIALHGFDRLFDACVIVLQKSDDNLARLLAEYDIDVAASWMIGDSERDDIAPAMRAGLRTILATYDEHLWSYNAADVKPTAVIASFPAIRTVLTEARAAA